MVGARKPSGACLALRAACPEIDRQQARRGHVLVDVPFLEESPDSHTRSIDSGLLRLRLTLERRSSILYVHNVALALYASAKYAACVPTPRRRALRKRSDRYGSPAIRGSVAVGDRKLRIEPVEVVVDEDVVGADQRPHLRLDAADV